MLTLSTDFRASDFDSHPQRKRRYSGGISDEGNCRSTAIGGGVGEHGV